jgi:serine/threonine-protein phosphatase PGAM5
MRRFLASATTIGTSAAFCTHRVTRCEDSAGTASPAAATWDSNWDFRSPKDGEKRSKVSRHVILVRHGQYDETKSERSGERKLTALGRQQAVLTGNRLAEMMSGLGERGRLRSIIVSDLTRAKETAAIVRTRLSDDAPAVASPDPNLNEGKPARPIPSKRDPSAYAPRVYRDGARIEHAFRTYFRRAKPLKKQMKKEEEEEVKVVVQDAQGVPAAATAAVEELLERVEAEVEDPVQHEFDIIICHGNVIRFFVMRALQLPPQAWLRLCFFNCSLTCLTIRPSGHVSLRYAGDVGHLPEADITYGSHEGWTW